MNNIINSIRNCFRKYGFTNLYGGDTFFDKEAIINEYLELYPEIHKKYDTYDQLYEDAVSHIGKISFKEKTKDLENYFYLLTNQDRVASIAIGMMAYFVATEVDSHGKDIEKSIDKVVSKIIGKNGIDTNNPFDIKSGKGHRVFGHDPVTFAFKRIPSDYIIYVKNEAAPMTKKTVLVRDFLNLSDDVNNVSMFDIIWKFYGNESHLFKGIWSCIGHTIIHFSKDLFTPEGLPIPFTSLFEKYEHVENDEISASILRYRDSFYKRSANAHIKASDFISLATIEVLIMLYCETTFIDKNKKDGYKNDMKLIAMGTCIALQCSKLMFCEELHNGKKGLRPIINGAKINLPLFVAYMNVVRKEVASIIKANKKLFNEYKRINDE